jgi:hypothetical protein
MRRRDDADIPRLALFQQIVSGVSATNARYRTLFRSDIKAHPILYFSDPMMVEYASRIQPALANPTIRYVPLPNEY